MIHRTHAYFCTFLVIPGMLAAELELPALPSLRRIVFDSCYLDYHHIHASGHGELLATYLLAVDESPLEEIVFNFVSVERGDVQYLAAPLLIQCFDELSFKSSLTRVEYRFQGYGIGAGEIEGYVRQAHEFWDRREILHVVVEDTGAARV